MTAVSITPVQLSPTTGFSWNDLDVSSYIAAGATGVLLHAINGDPNTKTLAFRKNGSTDDRTLSTGGFGGLAHYWAAIGVDSSGIFECFCEHSATQIWLVGYTMSECVFMTNAVLKASSTTGSWIDVDISSNTGVDTAIGAFFEFSSSDFADRTFGLRCNGSTDNRLAVCGHIWTIVGVDANEICEQQIASTDSDLYLTGYIKSGATFNVNAVDRSLSTTGSYLDLGALPDASLMGFYEVVSSSGSFTYHIRENGTSEDFSSYRPATLHAWALVKCDSGGLVEGRISNVGVDFYELGAFLSPDRSILLTGVSAAASIGALGKTVSPSLVGVSATGHAGTLGISVLKTLTGVVASSQAGSITPQLLIDLLGVEGAMALGALVADTATRVNLVGVSTTGSAGTFTTAVEILLAGNGMTGDVGELASEVSVALQGVAAQMGVGDFTITDGWTKVGGQVSTVWTNAPDTSTVWTDVPGSPTTWTTKH